MPSTCNVILAYEASGDPEGRIVVLLCEHAPLITIGRKGSRGHIHWTNEQLRQRQLEVRWVNRGGGCVLHGPGQLAVYPIVPLRWHGWSVGDIPEPSAAVGDATLDELGVRWEAFPPSSGVWGRSGLLAACGIAVRNDVAFQGMFLNVNPSVSSCTFIDAVDPATTAAGPEVHDGQSVGRAASGDLGGASPSHADSEHGCFFWHRALSFDNRSSVVG